MCDYNPGNIDSDSVVLLGHSRVCCSPSRRGSVSSTMSHRRVSDFDCGMNCFLSSFTFLWPCRKQRYFKCRPGLRTALFCVVTQRVVLISYRRTETSVRNYHYLSRNNTEERSSLLLPNGSLQSRINQDCLQSIVFKFKSAGSILRTKADCLVCYIP